MSDRIDHAANAVTCLYEVGDLTGLEEFARADLMVKAAQAEAVLALVEQQRIANLIALGHAEGGPYRYLDEGKKSLRARDAFDVAATLLGIEVENNE